MTLDLRGHFSQFRAARPDAFISPRTATITGRTRPARRIARRVADAARLADSKWETVFGEVIPRAQRGIAAVLGCPIRRPSRLRPTPTTSSGGCSRRCRRARRRAFSRATANFIPSRARSPAWRKTGSSPSSASPPNRSRTFAARFAAAARRGGHDLVFVSQVFFNSAATAGALADIVAAVRDANALVVIDGYHGFMALPTDLSRKCRRAFYLAGGYKYAMAGEGVCFLHCPPGLAMRPRDTGWFAEFGALAARDGGKVAYGSDGTRFMGATFDPTGLYRLAAMLDWMRTIGLTVDAIHEHVLALQELFLDEITRGVKPLCDARLVTPVGPGSTRGHFLTFETGAARGDPRSARARQHRHRRARRAHPLRLRLLSHRGRDRAGRARRRTRARLKRSEAGIAAGLPDSRAIILVFVDAALCACAWPGQFRVRLAGYAGLPISRKPVLTTQRAVRAVSWFPSGPWATSRYARGCA